MVWLGRENHRGTKRPEFSNGNGSRILFKYGLTNITTVAGARLERGSVIDEHFEFSSLLGMTNIIGADELIQPSRIASEELKTTCRAPNTEGAQRWDGPSLKILLFSVKFVETIEKNSVTDLREAVGGDVSICFPQVDHRKSKFGLRHAIE
jgi:hypothetical protein